MIISIVDGDFAIDTNAKLCVICDDGTCISGPTFFINGMTCIQDVELKSIFYAPKLTVKDNSATASNLLG